MRLRYLLAAVASMAPLLAAGSASADVVNLTGTSGTAVIKFNNFESFGNLNNGQLQQGSVNYGVLQVTSITVNGLSKYSAPSNLTSPSPSGDFILGVFAGITVDTISGSGNNINIANTGGTFNLYEVTGAQISGAGYSSPQNLFAQGTAGYAAETSGTCSVNNLCYHGITDVGATDYLNFNLTPGADSSGATLVATVTSGLSVPDTGSATGYGTLTGGAAQGQLLTGGYTTALGTKADLHFQDNFCSNPTAGSTGCGVGQKVGNWTDQSFDPATVKVPEPGSLAILGSGLMLLGAAASRRRRKSL